MVASDLFVLRDTIWKRIAEWTGKGRGILEKALQLRWYLSWTSTLTQYVFLEQDDILYENLTVYETLLYSARLRLPSSLGLPRMQERVEEVISQLGLESCRDTRIGSRDKRGISGGERKRVSIGIGLLSLSSASLLTPQNL